METLQKTLSFAQMMVRAQWRHEGRRPATPAPAPVAWTGPERRASPRPPAWAPAGVLARP